MVFSHYSKLKSHYFHINPIAKLSCRTEDLGYDPKLCRFFLNYIIHVNPFKKMKKVSDVLYYHSCIRKIF